MKALELKFARMRAGKSQDDMAAVIGKSRVSYSKKERGEVRFDDDEIVEVSRELNLTSEQVNDIFFDSRLPNR